MSDGAESAILGVSVRSWIALLLVYTVCLMAAHGAKIEEPLYSALLVVLGFLYGQKKAGQQAGA